MLSNIRFRQTRHNGCGDGKGNYSNFTQIFELKTTLLVPRGWSRKPTSLADAHEMLKVIAPEVLGDVAASLHSSPFYSIMADETTDSSNHEQVVICSRWVDNRLNAHEELIGL